MNLSVLLPSPTAGPSIFFHSLINHCVCVLIHLHPVSPLLISPSPSSPQASLIDVRLSLLIWFCGPCTIEVAPLGSLTWLSAALSLPGSVWEKNPFAVVSLPVDSNVCDSFCKPLLGTFRDCVLRTFSPALLLTTT